MQATAAKNSWHLFHIFLKNWQIFGILLKFLTPYLIIKYIPLVLIYYTHNLQKTAKSISIAAIKTTSRGKEFLTFWIAAWLWVVDIPIIETEILVILLQHRCHLHLLDQDLIRKIRLIPISKFCFFKKIIIKPENKSRLQIFVLFCTMHI